MTERLHFHALEKEMATHSSILAWRIPGTGEPGGLPSMGSHRVGHDWSDLAAAAAAEEPGRLPSMGSQRVGHNWATSLSPHLLSFPGGASGGKEPPCQCRKHNETRVRSLIWKDPLEEGMATESCLENPIDRRTWWAAVHRVAKS